MFDDQPTSAPTPPSNLPVEPDDIFKELEQTPVAPAKPNALDSGMLKPKSQPEQPTKPAAAPSALPRPVNASVTVPPSIELMGKSGESIAPVANPVLGRILLGVLVLIIVGSGGFGGWWVYTNIIQKKPVSTPTTQSTTELPTPTPTPVVETLTPSPVVAVTTTNENTDPTLDSDHDGLPDVQERVLGTDPNNPDTDNDGVTDGDEILKYRTNPLKADTDGDGYSDGTEIKNGYNPNGPGKLPNVNPANTPPADTNATSNLIPPTEKQNAPANSTSTLPPAIDL